ncbi:hypothetical protein C8R47DRAFT_1202973 [Mycena vitilis]|nr:hypothetical protein C8R47DRAFT_1202973 [Mycena vitilis]
MGMAKRGDALEYVARTRDELKQEWARRNASWPLILKNHLDLVQWAVRYCSPMVDIVDPAGKKVRQESIHEINVARVRRFAESQGLSPEDTLATPTIQKYLKYFVRDKTPIFASSLLLLKGSVFTELEILRLQRNSFFPASTGNSTAGQALRAHTQQQATKARRDGKPRLLATRARFKFIAGTRIADRITSDTGRRVSEPTLSKCRTNMRAKLWLRVYLFSILHVALVAWSGVYNGDAASCRGGRGVTDVNRHVLGARKKRRSVKTKSRLKKAFHYDERIGLRLGAVKSIVQSEPEWRSSGELWLKTQKWKWKSGRYEAYRDIAKSLSLPHIG